MKYVTEKMPVAEFGRDVFFNLGGQDLPPLFSIAPERNIERDNVLHSVLVNGMIADGCTGCDSRCLLHQYTAIDVPNSVDACKRHAHIQLPAKNFDCHFHARFSGCAKSEDIGSSDQAASRSKREGPQYVLAVTDASIEHNLNFGTDGISDDGKDRD